MNEVPTKVTITGKISYEDEITVAQAVHIIGYLNSDSNAVHQMHIDRRSGGGPDSGINVVDREHVSSPRAALEAAGATTNAEKIVALAAYILQSGKETFKLDAIKVQFQRAREALPRNLPRDLTTAIAAGWIAETHDASGQYYLTAGVKTVLKDGFPAKPNGGSRGRQNFTTTRSRKLGGLTGARRSGVTSKKVKPDVFASVDEFPNVVDGVAPYHEMPLQKDRLLWALWFAKEHDIKGLSNQDAAWLTDQLGDGVSVKNITARFDSLRKAGHANRSTVDHTLRITPSGEAHLKTLGRKRD